MSASNPKNPVIGSQIATTTGSSSAANPSISPKNELGDELHSDNRKEGDDEILAENKEPDGIAEGDEHKEIVDELHSDNRKEGDDALLAKNEVPEGVEGDAEGDAHQEKVNRLEESDEPVKVPEMGDAAINNKGKKSFFKSIFKKSKNNAAAKGQNEIEEREEDNNNSWFNKFKIKLKDPSTWIELLSIIFQSLIIFLDLQPLKILAIIFSGLKFAYSCLFKHEASS
ncbi:uncharacterized protein RJT21DRAFT_111974 [Scheffersomyces amazonensis]|uniref:uncharacterized protein n=1 Tax=Scheffersomyces amazonensis TaxID=1078765 RepID=UPI00315DB06B